MRVVSGIQPTGKPHLGNYLGALVNWTKMQDDYNAYYCVVDLHAITVPQEPAALRQNTRITAAQYLAAGIDENKSALFVQSHVAAHAQLAWVLNCITGMGEAGRMTQFKDKSAKREADFVSAGLFTYPALQAADILLYDAAEVPVGDDQRQHIEITRDIAVRFNHRFGDTFVLPKAVTPPAGARVMDLLDPTSKMSKSSETDAGCVYLLDAPSAIEKKFKRAVTDSENEVRYDREAKPGIANLLDILSAVTGTSPQQLADQYTQYGALKSDCGAAVAAMLSPIQDRYTELMNDKAELGRLLRIGAEKAGTVAQATLARAHDAIGFYPR